MEHALPFEHAYDVDVARNDHRHWWNGRWGSVQRRDVYLRTADDQYVVEAREGGAAGTSRRWQPPTEEHALQLVDELLNDQHGWRELTVRPTSAEDRSPTP